MYTLQQTFDIVISGLRKQGRYSYQAGLHEASCRYRSQNGDKCAAGLLISDEEYSPWMEGWPVEHEDIVPIIIAAGHDLRLVGALQEWHDYHAREGSDFQSIFTIDESRRTSMVDINGIAHRFGLTINL